MQKTCALGSFRLQFTRPILPLAYAHMRVIGHLATEATARTFGDYLFVQGIDNQIECQKNDGWAVWVNDEDKLESAAALLSAFRNNPTDPKYQVPARKATALREEQARQEEAYQKKVMIAVTCFVPSTRMGLDR